LLKCSRPGASRTLSHTRPEGIGQTELPGKVDFSVIDEIYAVSDKDAFLLTRQLARSEGIFAGGSAGSALYAALKTAEKMTEDDLIVTIIPDSGTRYLSKIYNDNWMRENQFLEPRLKVSAGQIVHDKQRRAEALVSVPLGITVEQAVNLMREHDISQVPVIEGGEVVGSISEHGFSIFWFPIQQPNQSRLRNIWRSRSR
jgi:cystathionine beta-synthase